MAFYLPKEILAEILKRLPAKSLIRFRCVQKYWYDLIHSSIFITLYSNYQKSSSKDKYLLSINKGVVSLCFDDEECEEYQGLEGAPILLGKIDEYGIPSNIGGISNDLICLYDRFVFSSVNYYEKIYLWNPVIRKFITLPDSPRSSLPLISLAFGFVPKLNDYKLVKLLNDEKGGCYLTNIVDVYTLSTNSWKIISQDNLLNPNYRAYIYQSPCVFVNGAAYWQGFIRECNDKDVIQQIFCFDTMKEVMHQISLPEYSEDEVHYFSIREIFGEFLAVFAHTQSKTIDVWVLEDQEIYFKKIFTVANVENNDGWNVLCSRNNGDVILRSFSKHQLISFNVKSGETEIFGEESGNLWSFFMNGKVRAFVESLVLLDGDSVNH